MYRSGCPTGRMILRNSRVLFTSNSIYCVRYPTLNNVNSVIEYNSPIRNYYHASVGTNIGSVLNAREDIDKSSHFDHYVAFSDVPVSEILKNKHRYKGATALVVNENESMAAVAHKMVVDWDVGATLVRDDNGHYTGIFTERDFLRKVAEYPSVSQKDWRDIPVKEFMTKHFTAVTSSTSCIDCMRIMTKGRFRRLPVVDEKDNDKVTGFVSLGDLVSTVISELKQSLEYYAEYISGKYSAPVTKKDEELLPGKSDLHELSITRQESNTKASM